jgi:hypothetical protein
MNSKQNIKEKEPMLFHTPARKYEDGVYSIPTCDVCFCAVIGHVFKNTK